MQLQDIIQKVRQEIGEPSVQGQVGTQTGGTWTDSQIIGYVNDAQSLLSRPARIQASPYQLSLTVGTNQYALPTDCIEDGIRKITWTSGGITYEVVCVGLDRWSSLNEEYTQEGDQSVTILGAVYALWAGNIYIYPTPTETGGHLTIYYYKTLPDLVNITDVSEIPARFHIALVKYAIAQCQAAVEESQLQMLAMQEFERLSAQMAMERTKVSRDRPARVRLRA